MTDFKPFCTSEIQLSLLENELNKIGCKQIQTYFPILSLLKKTDEIATSRLPNSNTVIKVYPIEKKEINKEYDNDDYTEQYVKTFTDCDILNTSTNKIKKQRIFIKFIPILEPVQYALGEFHTEDDKMNKNAMEQINKYNNTAYTEVFANYILSLLVEKNKCPHFPVFYGTYSSIMEWFQYDFTQEWNEIEEINFFKNQYEKGNIKYDFKNSTCKDSLNIMDIRKDIDLELEIIDLDAEGKDQHEIEIENGTNLDINSNDNTTYWCKIKNYPTQIGFFEKLEYTIEEVIEESGNFSLQEWKSILFQTIFALSFIQDRFNMIHNDLHCDNIMFIKTDQEYFYYVIDNIVYRVPTFGRVVKIIDFARATYSIGDTILFPDVFEENGDAHGQYDVPINNKWKTDDVTPNPSFDLVRLATTIYEYVSDEPEIMEMLLDWCKTDDDVNLLFEEDSFDLYCQIAHFCHNAIPKKQIQRNCFKEFILNITKDMIPFLKEQTLYNLN